MLNPSNIRSAQFLDTYFPIVDGVVQTVHNYALLLNNDAYSCVVTPKSVLKYDDHSLSYDVFRTSSLNLKVAEYSIPTPRFDKNLKSFLKEKNLDIMHAHSPFYEGSFASYYSKKLNIPCVATFHSKYYDDTLHITGSRIIAKYVTKKILRFYKSVDSVWACSNSTAKTLREYGFEGDIFVMDNGSSLKIPDNAPQLKEQTANKFDIPKNKKILLFVGHQIWHKNLKLILDTFRLICNNSDNYRLLIVGNGYDAEDIKKYSDSLNFNDGQVRFLGKIADRELLIGVYLNADLLFFPSVYDNAPLVVREAASLGVASLLTEGSNACEAVEKDVSGFTAEENKEAMYREIIKIFETENLLNAVSQRAQRDIPKSWEQIIKRVQNKYAEIIEKYNFEHK